MEKNTLLHVKTKKLKQKIWNVLIIFVMMIVMGNKSYAKEIGENGPGNLYAESAVLMDGDSGRVLYEKNGHNFMANASTTKILTCILALENAKLSDIVTVSAYAATMPDVQLHIREGEQYHLEDLLYSLMLESHNDVAVAIAEHVSGSVDGFSKLMNQKAREIGCKNSLFLTPNGLDATITGKGGEERFHGTTAEDLALLMRYCIMLSTCKEQFIKITSTPSHSFSDMENKRTFVCQNHNSLFNLMEGVISGKTGFTSKAGYCYVGAVKQEGKNYILALLACGWPNHKNYKWEDCGVLMEYGSSNFYLVDIESARQRSLDKIIIPVEEAQSEDWKKIVNIPIQIEQRKFDTVLLKKGEELNLKCEIQSLTAPIKAGQKIGSCKYYINDQLWREEAIFSGKNVEKIDFIWCIKKIVNKIV